MQKITQMLRTGLLYTLAVITVGGYPLTALAETATATPDQTTNISTLAPVPSQTAIPTPSPTASTPPPTPSVAPLPVSQALPTTDVAAPQISPTSPNISGTSTVPPVTVTQTPVAQAVNQPAPATTSVTTVKTDAGVVNTLTSTAKTGGAGAIANTTVGDAASGNATAETTVINSLHSTVGGDATGVAHFTADINGDVTGDITLAPTIDAALTQAPISDATRDLLVNNSANITNDINLNATSGNVDVSKNTTAGNATTGTANTVANVMNLINSIIAANKSFVGTINIYGNLNGDILVSPNFIPELLASNAPTSPTYSALGPASSDLTSVNNQSIINNINLQAMSGNAQAVNNTKAGNVTTGTGQTNLTVLNLTGQKVIASNSLLVFVNVLGKWVGMIVNAPAGATAAALGNGVTSNTISPFDQTVNSQSNGQITNNITLASQTGDANASANTTVGNVRTGNATASANIANIDTTSFSLSDWFGVLFINVFGSWYGSFGINTASGEVVPLNSGVTPANITSMSTTPAVKFGFTPRTFSTAHTNTLPIIPVLSGLDRAALENQPIVTTASMALGSSDNIGNTGVTEIGDQPQVGTVGRKVNPVALAMMATGLIGVSAPVLAGIGRRRRAK